MNSQEEEEEKSSYVPREVSSLKKSISSPVRPRDSADEDFISAAFIDYTKFDVRMKKIYSSGVQIVVINDYNNTFCPILSFHSSNFQYKMQDE